MTDIGKFQQKDGSAISAPRHVRFFFYVLSIIIVAFMIGCFVLLLQVREDTREHNADTEVMQFLQHKIKHLEQKKESKQLTENRKGKLEKQLLKKRIYHREFTVKQAAMKSILANCAMGMQSYDIQDAQIKVSSDYTPYFNGKYARLDGTARDIYLLGQSYGAWLPTKRPLDEQWLQVDLYTPRLVSGLVTQGRPKHYGQWVTSFKVSCGNSTDTLETVSENGKEKVFQGNTDRNSKVISVFPNDQLCRYIRFHPKTWHGTVALRLELLRGNCSDLKYLPLVQ